MGTKREIYEVTPINKGEFEPWKRALPKGWWFFDLPGASPDRERLAFLLDKVVTELLSQEWQMHSRSEGTEVFFRQFV